jgi:hypothetical protein
MKQFLFLLLLPFSVWDIKSQNIEQYFPEKELITTGIYYYPEQHLHPGARITYSL